MAVSGDTAVVGAFWEDSSATGVDGDQSDDSAGNSGAAYVFVRDGATWSQQAYLKASNTQVGDYFGFSVAIAGEVIVVGEPGEDSMATGAFGDPTDNSANDAGAVYVFAGGPGAWSSYTYLKAPATEASFEFGKDVAASGDRVLIRSSFISGALVWGSAHTYRESGGTWSEVTSLAPSLQDHGDGYGRAVDLSGNLAIVGAGMEGSAAAGVNGDSSDNSLSWAGASYLFELCASSGLAAEVVQPGTPANPIALLPGQTSGPVLGETWDPVIDHSTFLPSAVIDLLGLAITPSSTPTEFGTLICFPALYLLVSPASAPFQIAIPSDCAHVGKVLCFQGASWDGTLPLGASSLRVTNALDITIGTY